MDVNATFYSVTFQSNMRISKVAAWKSCQTQYLTTIYNLKRHFKLRALVCGCYHFQKILILLLWPKCWVCYEAYCSHSFFLLHSWPLYRPKSWNNAMYSFWLQKGVKNSTRSNFLICNPAIVCSFICYFWFMTILSSQKLKNAKYRFWLQKGVKNLIRQDFLIRGLKLYVVSLLLLSQNLFHEWMNSMDLIFSLITLRRIFWDETSFSFTFHAEKVSNEKLQFQVTKRDKKLYEQLFWTHHQN